MKKILIIGDAGRGKTTFAEKLSEKLGIPHYSLDDFFWEIKFTKPRGKEIDIEMARDCFQKDEWIVEGTTRRMLKLGLDEADKIFYLTHKNTFHQIWVLYKRYRSRKHETFKDLLYLIFHQIKKRKKLGKFKNEESFEDILEPYENKVIRLKSFDEINKYLN
jgi:adenylate kinase family enzyme